MSGVGRSSAHAVVIAAACLALVGCRQDMHDAPSYDPLQGTTFFANGAASRTLVANTVARGQLRADEHLYTGKVNGQVATEFPMPVTDGRDGPRSGALQRLLLAVPRPHRRRATA